MWTKRLNLQQLVLLVVALRCWMNRCWLANNAWQHLLLSSPRKLLYACEHHISITKVRLRSNNLSGKYDSTASGAITARSGLNAYVLWNIVRACIVVSLRANRCLEDFIYPAFARAAKPCVSAVIRIGFQYIANRPNRTRKFFQPHKRRTLSMENASTIVDWGIDA